MSEENFENKTKSDSNFTPTFIDHHLLPEIDFDRYCLINNNMSIPKAVINLYISYTLTQWLKKLNKASLNNCLFGSLKLVKNVNPDI